jgi:hypothetical protein
LRNGRIQQVTNNLNLNGLAAYDMEDKQNIKEISGVTDNAMGRSENSSESGVLYSQKVENANVLQEWTHDNAMGQLKSIGRYALGLIQANMTVPRALRIVQDDSKPYYVQLNVITVDGILNNPTVGEYDITISESPLGITGKEKQFEETVLLNRELMQMNQAYANPELVIKSSTSPFKQGFIERIQLVDGQIAEMKEMDSVMQRQEHQSNIAQNQVKQEQLELANEEKRAELDKGNQKMFENMFRQVM